MRHKHHVLESWRNHVFNPTCQKSGVRSGPTWIRKVTDQDRPVPPTSDPRILHPNRATTNPIRLHSRPKPTITAENAKPQLNPTLPNPSRSSNEATKIRQSTNGDWRRGECEGEWAARGGGYARAWSRRTGTPAPSCRGGAGPWRWGTCTTCTRPARTWRTPPSTASAALPFRPAGPLLLAAPLGTSLLTRAQTGEGRGCRPTLVLGRRWGVWGVYAESLLFHVCVQCRLPGHI